MKFGIRTPSFKKRFAARTSVKRIVRHNLGLKAPGGWGWLTNPKKAAYNRVYNRTSISADRLFAGSPKRSRSRASYSTTSAGCILLIGVILAVYFVRAAAHNITPIQITIIAFCLIFLTVIFLLFKKHDAEASARDEEINSVITQELEESSGEEKAISPIKLEPIQAEGMEPERIVNREIDTDRSYRFNPPLNTLIVNGIPVVGVTFNNPDGVSRQKILSHMIRWEAVDIVREPNNEHSSNAIAIVGGMGKIGHIDREYEHYFSSLIDSGATVLAKLSELYGGNNGKYFGAKVELHFKLLDTMSCYEEKIVGIKGKNENKEDRGEVASELKAGDLVSLSIDDFDEKERVFVEDAVYGNFGKLNASGAREIYPLIASGKRTMAFVSNNHPKDFKIYICSW